MGKQDRVEFSATPVENQAHATGQSARGMIDDHVEQQQQKDKDYWEVSRDSLRINPNKLDFLPSSFFTFFVYSLFIVDRQAKLIDLGNWSPNFSYFLKAYMA